MIRVLVVDDHQVIRSGLATLLESAGDISVDASAASGQEALDAAADQPTDVVLMDLSMPTMDGIEATRRLREQHPDLRVVVLTSYGDRRRIIEALDAGACGYLLKDEPAEAVIEGIRAVHAGHSMIPPQMAAMLVTEFGRLSRKAKERERGPKLTDREIEVLRLVARGAANKEIAKTLFISENTVKNHIRNILDKLQMHSRVAAAMYAMRTNLLDQD